MEWQKRREKKRHITYGIYGKITLRDSFYVSKPEKEGKTRLHNVISIKSGRCSSSITKKAHKSVFCCIFRFVNKRASIHFLISTYAKGGKSWNSAAFFLQIEEEKTHDHK